MTSRTVRRALAPTAALLLVAGLVAGIPGPAWSAGRPDLRVTAVSVPDQVDQGQVLTVTAQVRNTRGKRARRSHTRFYLSTDAKAGRSDEVLRTVRTNALKRRRSVLVKASAVPDVAHGRYYVVVCADAKRRVRESRESNNCRASKSRVQVGGDTSSTPSPDPGEFPKDPDPIDVTYTVDETAARTATVETWGGSITTTSADGTSYRLDLPANALLSRADITLSPVSSLSGAPLSGGVRAVEILPHGLALMKEATLTITPPAGTDLTTSTGFLFDAGGLDFHAFPATFDPSAVTMHLTHFSTPGIGRPVAGEVAPGAGRWPRRSQAQLEASMAEVVARERQNVLEGGPADPDLDTKLEALMEQWETDVLQPLLQGGTPCGAMDTAREGIASAYGLMRSRALLDGDPALSPTTQTLLEQVWTAQADCLRAACVEEHHIGAGRMLLGLVRQHQLLGNVEEAERIMPWAEQCWRFELVLEATHTKETHWVDGAPAGGGGSFFYSYDESELLSGGTSIPMGLDVGHGLSGSSTVVLSEIAYSENALNVTDEGEEFTGSSVSWDPGVASARMVPDLNMYLPRWADGWMPAVPFQRNEVDVALSSNMWDLGEPYVHDPLTETYSHTDEHGTTNSTSSRWQAAVLELASGLGLTGSGGLTLEFGVADQVGATFLDRTWVVHEEGCPEAEATCDRDTTLQVQLVHTPQG